MTIDPKTHMAAGLLRAGSRAYASAAVHEMEAVRPELLAHGLPETFVAPLDDIEIRVLQLAASVEFGRPALLADALRWYKVAFHHRDVPADYLPESVASLGRALTRELPPGLGGLVHEHLMDAARDLREAPVDLPMVLDRKAPLGELAMRFLLANLEGRGDDALDLLRMSLRDGVSIADLHDHVLTPAQREVGRMWLMAEIPIADEHYGSAIVDRALWILQEHIPRARPGAPRVVTLGVGGNLHDLGLRVVAQRLQIAGFAVHHLGANMPASDIDWALQDRPVELVALSATLAMHLPTLRQLVSAVRSSFLRLYGSSNARPILVGGAPFRIVDDLWELVGADAAAGDAIAAVHAAQRLMARPR